jgi:hypothetical protein
MIDLSALVSAANQAMASFTGERNNCLFVSTAIYEILRKECECRMVPVICWGEYNPRPDPADHGMQDDGGFNGHLIVSVESPGFVGLIDGTANQIPGMRPLVIPLKSLHLKRFMEYRQRVFVPLKPAGLNYHRIKAPRRNYCSVGIGELNQWQRRMLVELVMGRMQGVEASPAV